MPYKSEAQRRYFHWAKSQGKISPSEVDKWDKESEGKKIPERLNKEKSGKHMNKESMDKQAFPGGAQLEQLSGRARELGGRARDFAGSAKDRFLAAIGRGPKPPITPDASELYQSAMNQRGELGRQGDMAQRLLPPGSLQSRVLGDMPQRAVEGAQGAVSGGLQSLEQILAESDAMKKYLPTVQQEMEELQANRGRLSGMNYLDIPESAMDPGIAGSIQGYRGQIAQGEGVRNKRLLQAAAVPAGLGAAGYGAYEMGKNSALDGVTPEDAFKAGFMDKIAEGASLGQMPFESQHPYMTTGLGAGMMAGGAMMGGKPGMGLGALGAGVAGMGLSGMRSGGQMQLQQMVLAIIEAIQKQDQNTLKQLSQDPMFEQALQMIEQQGGEGGQE